MSRLCWSMLLGLSGLLVGCYSTDSRIQYDRSTDFSRLTTYTWMPDAVSAFTIEVNGKHYVNAMDVELKSKGLSMVKENGDFSIQTHRVTSHRDEYKSVSGGVDFPKATLQVEFLNPATRKPIWEGTEELYISEHAATQESKKVIYDAVGTLLKDFPPPNRK